MAIGAAAVSLCSMSGETIEVAEQDLPKNLCPLIKASYGFAKTDKCPYFYFSDLIVGETTCDGKKKMYELMSQFKDVYVMQLPQSQDERGRKFWRESCLELKRKLEEKFGTVITDEAVRQAVHTENGVRRALQRFYGVMKHDPAPITGLELFRVLYGSTFKLDRSGLADDLNALTDKIEAEYAAGKKLDKRPRILITGCPMGGATEKVIEAIENNGGVVVTYENCSGAKAIEREVKEDTDDIYGAIADRYLGIGCSVMTPNHNRFELLNEMIDEYRVDGVVEMVLQACHTYSVESKSVRRFVTQDKEIPYIYIETDYSKTDVGQLNTRLAAFVEML